tara:strand:+ start:3374 stop:4600 length:1227 start_codon:yes stop_codon:yes gene_type:complete
VSFVFTVVVMFLSPLASVVVQAQLQPPQDFRVMDTPNDGGRSLTLGWRASTFDGPSLQYRVLIAMAVEGPYQEVAAFSNNQHFQKDTKSPWWAHLFEQNNHRFDLKSGGQLMLSDGTPYWVKLVIDNGMDSSETQPLSATSFPNFFNWAQANNLLLLILFTVAVLFSILRARKNPHGFLRRIEGLDAVEEAIGRATEMGKPILYLTGSAAMDNPSTIAATVVLSEVAKKVSAYEAGLIVPHRDPIVLAICQEITKEAYTQTGHPDAYKTEMNFYITDDQFSYTAAVQGIMLRERPAAIFMLGYYYAESLLLAETGHEAGAIQIAGTDADHQLPFFFIACDYTLMGEELYAASAYLSREPVMVGTLRAQDMGKAVLLGALILGVAISTIGEIFQTETLMYVAQVFYDFK